MKVDFTNKAISVLGLRGTGKSVWVRWLCGHYPGESFVYDTVRDIGNHDSIDTYIPKSVYSSPEFESIIKWAVKTNKYKLIAVDEANRFLPSKPAPLPGYIAELNDLFRHNTYGKHGELTLCYIARRPVMLNQDILELSDYLVIFRLVGKNDRSYLNSIADGLGDTVVSLQNYSYCLVFPDRTYKVMPKVQLPLKVNKEIEGGVNEKLSID